MNCPVCNQQAPVEYVEVAVGWGCGRDEIAVVGTHRARRSEKPCPGSGHSYRSEGAFSPALPRLVANPVV